MAELGFALSQPSSGWPFPNHSVILPLTVCILKQKWHHISLLALWFFHLTHCKLSPMLSCILRWHHFSWFSPWILPTGQAIMSLNDPLLWIMETMSHGRRLFNWEISVFVLETLAFQLTHVPTLFEKQNRLHVARQSCWQNTPSCQIYTNPSPVYCTMS